MEDIDSVGLSQSSSDDGCVSYVLGKYSQVISRDSIMATIAQQMQGAILI